jgi:hypothetical protein
MITCSACPLSCAGGVETVQTHFNFQISIEWGNSHTSWVSTGEASALQEQDGSSELLPKFHQTDEAFPLPTREITVI